MTTFEEAVLTDLYGVPRSEFIAARDERAHAAPGTLQAGIRALRRPSPSAWLVNQLMRHHGEELRATLALGDRLRAAQAEFDAAQLGQLTRERRRLVTALVEQSVDVARRLGQPASAAARAEVAETLSAALGDAGAAEAVLSGRLLRSLVAVGFDPVDVDGAVATLDPTTTPRHLRLVSDSAEQEHRRAYQEARDRVTDAENRVSDAARRSASTARRLDSLAEDRADLEARLRAVRAELASAEREMRSREAEQDRAADALTAAQAQLDALT